MKLKSTATNRVLWSKDRQESGFHDVLTFPEYRALNNPQGVSGPVKGRILLFLDLVRHLYFSPQTGFWTDEPPQYHFS